VAIGFAAVGFVAIMVVCLGGLEELHAQGWRGELRLKIEDPNGHAMAAHVTLSSEMNHLHRRAEATADGISFRELPMGVYQLEIEAADFAAHSEIVEVRSAYPIERTIVMKVEAESTTVPVSSQATMLDPADTGTVYRVGPEDIATAAKAGPGRTVINLALEQPGWLAEANGVVHPRGSEYDTQVIVDGQPMFDNRSPAFAPGFDDDEVQSIRVLTSNFPAEYGRKLGGVIDVTTPPNSDAALHGSASLAGGSYAAVNGSIAGAYAWTRDAVNFGFADGRTDRYLDSPVEANYTNQGSVLSGSAGFDHEFGARDRLNCGVRYGDAAFLVPNELVQQENGQVQKRTVSETGGRCAWQHVFTPDLLWSLQGRGRDLTTNLRGNVESTPILPFQERGFREGYVQGVLAGQNGRHSWKAGADVIVGAPHERFAYQITDPGFYPPGTPLTFAFAEHGHDNEQSWFVQDLIRVGDLALSLGLRWDHYNVIVNESAWSPRVGAAYAVKRWDLVLRGSYDRIFQTPAIENLLLASSPEARTLNGESAYLPVRPARGNYFDGSVAKGFGTVVTWNVSYYRREIDNFSDDDLLLNTGVSFPIAFRHGSVYGIESKVEIPHWGPISGALSYSYMVARAELPVTGGLFLGDDTAQLQASGTIPVSQDQRNTANGRLRYQVNNRLWIAAGGTYSSGLPVDLNGPADLGSLIQQYGEQVVSKVNFDAGRVRPSATVDLSAGYQLWKHEAKTLRLQGDVLNVGNRLNVINFAGVFSGTALAPRRNFAVRLQGSF
jgi:hypothetical protein